MKPLRANTFLADRGARIAGQPFESRLPPSPPGGRVRTAPDAPPPASGAGVLLTQGSAARSDARAAHNREVTGSTPVPATNSAAGIVLTDPAMIMLRAVAAYERCDMAQAVTIALAAYVREIGAGPLARAALDASEATHNRESDEGEGGNPAVLAWLGATTLDGDLTDVPSFARVGGNRFRSGGP